MDATLIGNLNNLNRKFYSEVAIEFDGSRDYAWHGWETLAKRLEFPNSISQIPNFIVRKHTRFKEGEEVEGLKLNTSFKKILDVGCGNGRFGSFLGQFFDDIEYTGIDFSTELIDAAKERLKTVKFKYELYNWDLLGDWDKQIKEKYDLIVVFGVFHHIAGHENRKLFMKKLASKLADNGVLVFTVWQFPMFDRFDDRKVSKDKIEELGIDPTLLEKDDYILDWRRGKTGYRYCHYNSPEEVERLIQDTGLIKVNEYEEDGRSRNVNKYYIFKR